jgi:hypothetical protein
MLASCHPELSEGSAVALGSTTCKKQIFRRSVPQNDVAENFNSLLTGRGALWSAYGVLNTVARYERPLRAARANHVFGTDKSNPYQKHGYC